MSEWSERDRELAVGLIAYEGAYTHGHPIKKAYHKDSDGHYVAEPVIDHVQAAIDRAMEKNKTPEPGTRYVVWDLRLNPEKDHLEH